MIAVLQAYKEGKTIEVRLQGSQYWTEIPDPIWNFLSYDYRVKPEHHYRPFKSAEEVMEAIKEHGDWVRLNITDWISRLIGYSDKCVDFTGYHNIPFEEAFRKITFADGTPFGVLEKEGIK